MSSLELELWQRIAGLEQSVSHDFHHIRRVQAYANQLQSVYGGDPEILTAATILHDLGRGDRTRKHGLESIEASRELASTILGFVDLDSAKKELVLRAIETHDQPELRPEILEARILKDADFLAGFGAWGILRIAMWSGESGRRVEEVLDKLGRGMRRRYESLEFDLSRDIARRELLFAQIFLSELGTEPTMPPEEPPGKYIVLEGISGSGKNTMAQFVHEELVRQGSPPLLVEEPWEPFRELREALPDGDAEASLPPLMKSLFMADRHLLMEKRIKPALRRGNLVISVRSYLSTAVYQTETDSDAYATMLAHDWVPRCDLLVILDLRAEEALARIALRDKSPGNYETEPLLRLHRARYLRYSKSFDARHHALIDASGPKDSVGRNVLKVISEAVGLDHEPAG